jgi:hypothetical protein
MVSAVRLALTYIRDSFRSQEELKAEVIVLRHQLNVLRRRVAGRVRLGGLDRALFVWLYRLFPSLLKAIVVVRPETVIGWHRAGYRAWWCWRSKVRLDDRRSTGEIGDRLSVPFVFLACYEGLWPVSRALSFPSVRIM